MVDLSMHSYNYCYFELNTANMQFAFNGRSMKHLLKTMVATVVALSFTGCGMVSQGITSEDTYLDRAESATGVDKSQLTLDKDSISGSLDSVNFDVYDKQGNRYKCYFGSALPVIYESSAMCTKISKDGSKSSGNQGHCNELLKAAGKC